MTGNDTPEAYTLIQKARWRSHALQLMIKTYLKLLTRFAQKKKHRPDINGLFNYLTKIEKIENVSLEHLSERIMNLEKKGEIVYKMLILFMLQEIFMAQCPAHLALKYNLRY